jgi:hypothetical protein
MKIAKEVAEAEFLRFIEAMDLDADTTDMSEEDVKGFNNLKAPLIKAIQKGNLVVNESGEFVFTPTKGDGKSIVFKEPTGSSLQAQDKRKSAETYARLYLTMGDMTGMPASYFSSCHWRDLKVMTSIVTLFLA